MSIFFYHVVLSILSVGFALSFVKIKFTKFDNFIFATLGVLSGFFIFYLAKISAWLDEIKIFADVICIATLLILLVKFKFNSQIITRILSFLMAFSYAYEYKFISINFPIFSLELLDSSALANFFIAVFGFTICICVYFLLKNLNPNTFIAKISVAFLIVLKFGSLILTFMQIGIIQSYPKLLSIIAKIIYLNEFLPIFLSIFLLVFATINLFKINKINPNENIINFRIKKADNNAKILKFLLSVILGGVICAVTLFYILIASKPPRIDDPIIIEPVEDKFVFDANILQDGKLHRYAYIADDGHKIRFFLLNKFPDKLAPVAVFDACSICGDMGYVKKGDELICISCNVRIFLPSVGKAGGCNPIPLKFEFDGEKISIALSEIESGATYFSQIVEKTVTDPVSGAKIKNNSKFSHLAYGKIYFFENKENLEKFEANPEIYIKGKR